MNRNQQDERSQMNNNAPQDDENSKAIKNPDDWKTGDEEMTGAQKSYLSTLSQEAGEDLEQDLTKAEASKKIDELQQKTGRGVDH